jgi:prepilin signal peptidase PulO-like enzyme (type II secretory pathway)
MILAIVLGFIFFALAGFVGILLGNTASESLQRFEDGPAPLRVPSIALIAACGVIGAIVTPHAQPSQVGLIAIVALALVAIWVTDSRTGMVPDVFTLGPLAVLLLVAVVNHHWLLIVSAVVPFVPFAIAAALSKGRGMGWGDAKLVALGGAVLGAEAATLAFAVACGVAVAVAYAGKRGNAPIAFAPYLAAAIAVAIPIGVLW